MAFMDTKQFDRADALLQVNMEIIELNSQSGESGIAGCLTAI